MDDRSYFVKLIGELSEAKGVSGFEDEVISVLRRHLSGCNTDITEDSLRNLYVRPKSNTGKRPVVMVDAHSDEVGFMVQSVLPNGTLAFIPLGGWNPECVAAHAVMVRTESGTYIPGVVASKPPHFRSETEKNAAPKISDMVIDIGASGREEAIRDFGIRLGAPIVPDVDFRYLEKNDLLYGKAFDCRIGCAAVVALMKTLSNKNSGDKTGTVDTVDIVGTFTSQEEVGGRGAAVAVRTVAPEAALLFEGCPADDTFTSMGTPQAALKKGPMLRHFDNGMITNPRFQRFALDTAAAVAVPVQEAVRTGGKTNAALIHTSLSGIPTIVISIPVRYVHTHYGLAALEDFEGAVTLGTAIIAALNTDVIAGF